jgi:hypothetical protein
MQFFSIIIIYFCCLYELLFTSICKLSKISDFIFYYMYFHYNIVHKYFTFIIIFILGSFLHLQFSQNILPDKWGKIIMYPYALPNHQQNQGYQHYIEQSHSLFFLSQDAKDAKNKYMVVRLKNNSYN